MIKVYVSHIELDECQRKNEVSRYQRIKNPENKFLILHLAVLKTVGQIQGLYMLNQRFESSFKRISQRFFGYFPIN